MTLGCADNYMVQFISQSGLVLTEIEDASQVSWNRRLDDYSTASTMFQVSGSDDARKCCQDIERLDVRRHKAVIWRQKGSSSEQVWVGNIQNIIGGRSFATVDMVDDFAFYKQRIFHQQHNYTNVDLAYVWNQYITDANSVDPIITELAPNVGITISRDITSGERRIAWNELRELLDTGMDVTIHIGNIIYGGKEIFVSPIVLSDDHFLGDVNIVKAGSKIVSVVYMNGAGDIKAQYPPAGVPTNIYGLVERVFVEENITDLPSLQTAAKTRYDQLANQPPYYIDIPDGSSLAPDTPMEINELIAGRALVVEMSDTCPEVSQAMRISEVQVDMATDEDVKISLQPLGTVANDADESQT